jgi:hypothetical protein
MTLSDADLPEGGIFLPKPYAPEAIRDASYIDRLIGGVRVPPILAEPTQTRCRRPQNASNLRKIGLVVPPPEDY